MDSFGRLLQGAVGIILDVVDGAVNKYDASSYYSGDTYQDRYLQEESATGITPAPIMMPTAVDEMAGAGAGVEDGNSTDLKDSLGEIPDQFAATEGLTDAEVLRTTCKLYGSIFLILFIIFLIFRKAFPGA